MPGLLGRDEAGLGVPPAGRRRDRQDWYPDNRKDRCAMNPLLGRISVDPNVCFGKPCIRGTRIWVSLLLDFLASEMTMEQILEEYPQLTRDDILAAIAYGAEMSRGRFVDLPGQTAA
jgi:uncharacterized protein (DUF433 family)